MRTEGYADRDDGDFGAPTPEQREIINGSLRRFPIYESPNSRVIVGYGHQIVHPLRKLFDNSRLDQEDIDAASHFQRDFIVGTRVSGLTMKYGERMGAGGTPVSQQANTSRKSPEQIRSEAHLSYLKACDWVGRDQSPWLTAVVCEVPVGEPGKVPSFEDVGREYAGYTNRPQAKSAGETLIMEWVRRLSKFYGTR